MSKNKKQMAKVVKDVAIRSEFLPEGYKIPKKSDQFKKLTVGKHKMRIMTAPIRGYVFFAEEIVEGSKEKKLKPIRRTENLGNFSSQEMIELGAKIGDEGKLEVSRYFWLFLIWDYTDSRFKCLEVTQTSVLDPLMKYLESEDYGDPRNYDITIERTGTGKNNTEYSVLPSPPKKLDPTIQAEYEKLVYNLNSVLEGGYPMS